MAGGSPCRRSHAHEQPVLLRRHAAAHWAKRRCRVLLPTRFILNDEEVEIVAVDATGEFVEVKSLPTAVCGICGIETGQPPVQGWVRARNVTKHKRESGLAGLKRQISEQLIQEAAKVVPSAPPSLGKRRRGRCLHVSVRRICVRRGSRGDGGGGRAAHVASHLKHAPKSNLADGTVS